MKHSSECGRVANGWGTRKNMPLGRGQLLETFASSKWFASPITQLKLATVEASFRWHKRVLKSASLDFSVNDFPGSQIRLLLHNSHTGNKRARENPPVAANCFFATKFFDGTSHLHRSFIRPLTSPLGSAQNQTRWKRQFLNFSIVQVRPNCSSLPLRRSVGWSSRPLATAWRTYNTVGSLPLGLVSRLRHIKTFASSASACALASRLPRKTKT